jgi:transposase
MFSEKKKAAQPEFWIAADQVVTTAQTGFYAKLEETLESFGFAAKVRALCQSAYDKSGVGRPGIDPVVYLKMIMVGFFEDLPSERAIAARCADSMSIRTFLKYELHEKTQEHSSFTVIRQRLGLEIYQEIFTLTLQALREHGLLRGKNLGIDSSVIEANASLRALVNRNTEEQYWDYVKRLAAEQGIDPEDPTAVRRFDRHRRGKGSNQEWQNPHDPDAKIGRTKDGATDMIYKPESVVDLDTGAIILYYSFSCVWWPRPAATWRKWSPTTSCVMTLLSPQGFPDSNAGVARTGLRIFRSWYGIREQMR